MTQFIPRHTDGTLCLTAVTTGNCPLNHDYYGGDLTPAEGRELILAGGLVAGGLVTLCGEWVFAQIIGSEHFQPPEPEQEPPFARGDLVRLTGGGWGRNYPEMHNQVVQINGNDPVNNGDPTFMFEGQQWWVIPGTEYEATLVVRAANR